MDDEDYDPDAMFSIDSPGSALVMFIIGAGETKPEDTLQSQIRPFEKLISRPAISRFEKYGRYTGNGAILKGRVMGIKTTVRLFCFHQNGLTVMITEQCPDEDLKPVQAGLRLIEGSFSLTADNGKETPK